MTKVERLLINKGHYLDDTYYLVMDIVKVVDNLKDNVAERLDDDLSDDAYAMCEEMFTAVEQCKADMVEAIEDIVERMEVKDAQKRRSRADVIAGAIQSDLRLAIIRARNRQLRSHMLGDRIRESGYIDGLLRAQMIISKYGDYRI